MILCNTFGLWATKPCNEATETILQTELCFQTDDFRVFVGLLTSAFRFYCNCASWGCVCTSGSVCSTPELSGDILSSPETSCAYREPDKKPCKQTLLDQLKCWFLPNSKQKWSFKHSLNNQTCSYIQHRRSTQSAVWIKLHIWQTRSADVKQITPFVHPLRCVIF